MDTKTSQFHYAKFEAIPDGSVILPTRVCKACDTEVSEFWITSCNQCGSTLGDSKMIWDPKNKDIKYLVLDDPELIKRFQSEATWLCTAPIGHESKCLSLNDNNSDICSNILCMANRKEHGYTIPKYQPSSDGHFSTAAEVLIALVGKDKIVISPRPIPITTQVTTQVKEKIANTNPIKIGIGVLTSIFVTWQSIFWLAPSEVSGTVQHYNWNTVIRVEHMVTKTSSDWSTPIGAYNISSSQQVKSYDSVQTGSHVETQNKSRQVVNGTESYDCSSTSGATIVKNTCSRNTYGTESYTEDVTVPDYTQVPVYAPYHTYDVDSMEFYKNVNKDGIDTTPTYPVYIVGPGEQTLTSCTASIEVIREGKTETVATQGCSTITQFTPGKHVSYMHNRANNSWAPKLN
jgi:hypothetical protein